MNHARKIRRWSNKEVYLLTELYPTVKVKHLVEKFPYRTKATIVAKALSLGLLSRKLWQSEENNILHKYFTEASKEKLLRLLPKRSWTAIIAHGERMDLKRNTRKPRIKVDEDYFKKWSPNMAYILGFIIADGCIVKGTYSGYSDALKFGVQRQDIDILKKIKQELSAGHKISCVKNAAHLCITSQKIVNDLKNLGIDYRKSLREKIPNISPENIRDLIRGIVDGDGSINFNKRGYPTLSIYGGKQTITFIQNHFLLKFNIYSSLHRLTKSKNNRYLFNIAYQCNPAKTLIEYLYVDANLYLKRKFNLSKRAMITQMRKNNNKRYALSYSRKSS